MAGNEIDDEGGEQEEEEAEQKKKSQAIDKILEEDSRRLRKECKILLLGARTLILLQSSLWRWPRPSQAA